MTTNISLRQLQALEGVIRHGSFTEAARALGVSQPTVSNLVSALETQYKCKLVDRSGPKVRPTELMASILGHVKAISALSEELDGILSERRDLKTGTISIVYSTYQISMPHISEFVRSYPNVDVTARAMATDDIVQLLLTGQADAGFVTFKKIPDYLEGVVVTPVRIGVLLPVTHPLADKDLLSWRDMEGLNLVQREPSSGTRQLFEAAAARAGVELNTILGIGSWGSILALVRAGVGVGVGFDVEYVGEPDMVMKFLDDPELTTNHCLACLPTMRRTSLVEALFEVLAASPDR